MINTGILFSIIGSLVSIYHIYIENGGANNLVCSVIDPTVAGQSSCAIRYVYEFGYVTIPVMSLTLFIFILFLLINFKIRNK